MIYIDYRILLVIKLIILLNILNFYTFLKNNSNVLKIGVIFNVELFSYSSNKKYVTININKYIIMIPLHTTLI